MNPTSPLARLDQESRTRESAPGWGRCSLEIWLPSEFRGERCAHGTSGSTSSVRAARACCSCSLLSRSCDACTYRRPSSTVVSYQKPLLVRSYIYSKLMRMVPLGTLLPTCRLAARAYLWILVTRPAPTVRPPSRIANRRPSSIAIGLPSVTYISVLSPGITISVPSGNETAPVTSVVRK